MSKDRQGNHAGKDERSGLRRCARGMCPGVVEGVTRGAALRSSMYGFTMLELMVASSLLILCLMITFPALANLKERSDARSAASMLSSDLLTMRYRAIADAATYRLRIDGPHGYSIERRMGVGWVAVRKRDLGRAVTIEANNSPVFTRAGAITNMATMFLSISGQKYRKVSVGITGRVKAENLK